jgi:hypothetical protein
MKNFFQKLTSIISEAIYNFGVSSVLATINNLLNEELEYTRKNTAKYRRLEEIIAIINEAYQNIHTISKL